MKEAKRTQITEAICKQAQLMRRGGANQTEIGKLLGVNPCTISRIEAAGFDLETYQENRKAQREKEKAAKRPAVELVYDPEIAEEYRKEQEAKAAEELPGQMKMELTMAQAPKPVEGIQVEVDQTKLMRFQAHMTDDLKKTIIDMIAIVTVNQNKLYDMVCQLIRAVRKE